MGRYGYLAFLLYVAAVAGFIGLLVYRIVTDVTVPLFGN